MTLRGQTWSLKVGSINRILREDVLGYSSKVKEHGGAVESSREGLVLVQF